MTSHIRLSTLKIWSTRKKPEYYLLSTKEKFLLFSFLSRFFSGKQNNKTTRKNDDCKTYDSGDNYINWYSDSNCFTNCHLIHNTQWFYLSKRKWLLPLPWKRSSWQCLFWNQLMKELIKKLIPSTILHMKLAPWNIFYATRMDCCFMSMAVEISETIGTRLRWIVKLKHKNKTT